MRASVKKFAVAGLSLRAIAAAALSVGCIAAPGFVHAATASDRVRAGQDQPNKKVEKQVAAAERAAIKAPQDPSARARLAQMYLAAGRFASAGTSFEDAVALGDKSPSTALGMALSYIASGRNGEAVALLGQWGDAMPASDHGLALALAGDPAQAITILTAAIKQGENTPKMRQNLAYAYAMGGQLAEARVIAAQDVPLDKLDTRVSEWALQASVGSQQSRVATLLGAPVRSDPGRPAQLALASPTSGAALAASDVPAPPAAPAEELPALGAGASALAQASPQGAPQFEPAPTQAAPAPQEPVMAEAAPAARQYAGTPVVQDIAARIAARQAVQEHSARAHGPSRKPDPAARERKSAGARMAAAPAAGTHLVQLGSFTTEAGAHRAWNIFVSRDRSLKGRELHITEAMVNGRRYFRVAAAGYEAAEARSKCSSLKGRGSDCLALAVSHQPAGSPTKIPTERLARR